MEWGESDFKNMVIRELDSRFLKVTKGILKGDENKWNTMRTTEEGAP